MTASTAPDWMSCSPSEKTASGSYRATGAAFESHTATKPDAPGPAKFYGAVSAVDTKAMTFTIDNQVYNVVAETQMTKAADNSKATLADAIVGEPARGTYTRSDDGKLNVTKVRFGKK